MSHEPTDKQKQLATNQPAKQSDAQPAADIPTGDATRGSTGGSTGGATGGTIDGESPRSIIADLLIFVGPIMSAGGSGIIIVRGGGGSRWYEGWFYWLLVGMGLVIWLVGVILKPAKRQPPIPPPTPHSTEDSQHP